METEEQGSSEVTGKSVEVDPDFLYECERDRRLEEGLNPETGKPEKDGSEKPSKTGEVLKRILLEVPAFKNNFLLVGKWIWASFEENPVEEIKKFLIETGFKWNAKREVWQNACGVYCRSSDSDPRKRYPVFPLSEL